MSVADPTPVDPTVGDPLPVDPIIITDPTPIPPPSEDPAPVEAERYRMPGILIAVIVMVVLFFTGVIAVNVYRYIKTKQEILLRQAQTPFGRPQYVQSTRPGPDMLTRQQVAMMQQAPLVPLRRRPMLTPDDIQFLSQV